MSKFKLIVMSFIISFVSGCVTPQAKVDFDKNSEVDTSNYRKFVWLNEQKILAPVPGINLVMKARVEKAIEEEFISKGYQLINDATKADFMISYTLGNREKIKIYNYPTTYNRHTRWSGRYPIWYSKPTMLGTEIQTRQYNEGKLVIDIYDANSHQPVWHGWAVKRLIEEDKGFSPNAVKIIVKQVLEQFY